MVDLEGQRSRIDSVLRSRWESVLRDGRFVAGPEVGELEDRLAQFCGVREAVAVGNGTDAVVLALRALRVEAGHAVVVPSFTFAATAEAVVLAGAVPVFADVDPRTFLLTRPALDRAITAASRMGLKVAAVVCVDLFGQPVDVSTLREAVAPGLPIISDAAQSFGATCGNHRVGSLADMTTTSFYPSKPLGCYGDGGAVICNDPEAAASVRSLRNHGAGSDRYQHLQVGMNSRLDTLQAAVLLAKLDIFEAELVARQGIATRYGAAIAAFVDPPEIGDRVSSSWAQYTIQCDDRDSLRDALAAQGIATAVHYPVPLHRQPAYAGYPVAVDGCPVSEDLARRVVSLPMHPYLSSTDQDAIVTAVTTARDELAALHR